jgi:CrcB protein
MNEQLTSCFRSNSDNAGIEDIASLSYPAMNIILAVGLGSLLGGLLRYGVSRLFHADPVAAFPLGTLTVNLLGCLIIGLIIGYAAKNNVSREWMLFWTTGLLGGFTTFSTFSIETVMMFRTGLYWQALLYVALSIILGLTLTLAGFLVSKNWTF